ncbi:hypothetical protein MW887_001274 [Aspergillus wentii]|nr:hypothetical protein MW887_001274 [Aspergillus wentii]
MCLCDCYPGMILGWIYSKRSQRVMKNKIYFDGALPVLKRETRLQRLEKSRRRLELFRFKTQQGFPAFEGTTKTRAIDPQKVLQSRNLYSKYNDLPDNPFMVSAVFEDLKNRWNKESIMKATQGALHLPSIDLDEFPWAGITIMVPGEADVECAYTAKLTGCAVLTNDSDLLLYDLGTHGSVLFLNSVEMIQWDILHPEKSRLNAVRLCPTSLASRLGVANLQQFAYELKNHTRLGFSELIERSKNTCQTFESRTDYCLFAEEYEYSPSCHLMRNLSQPIFQHFDPRVSELFCQYEFRDTHTLGMTPKMYLPILNEDHSRRSAWGEGRLYRCLGYSVLNASRPTSERFASIDEYVRRGQRISADVIDLGNNEWISAELEALHERLKSAQFAFNGEPTSSSYWRMFALCEVYGRESRATIIPDAGQLSRFLRLGYMGERLEWTDIHLFAQAQAVLYSLRILKQFLELSVPVEGLVAEMISTLAGLPPLHIIMGSIREMVRQFQTPASVSDFVDKFFRMFEHDACFCIKPDQEAEAVEQLDPPRRDITSPASQCLAGGSQRAVSNMFELLGSE